MIENTDILHTLDMIIPNYTCCFHIYNLTVHAAIKHVLSDVQGIT